MDHWPKMPNQSRETAIEQSSRDVLGVSQPSPKSSKGQGRGVEFPKTLKEEYNVSFKGIYLLLPNQMMAIHS